MLDDRQLLQWGIACEYWESSSHDATFWQGILAAVDDTIVT